MYKQAAGCGSVVAKLAYVSSVKIFDVLCGMGFKTSNRSNVAVPKPAGSRQRGQRSRGRGVHQRIFQEKIQGKLIIEMA
ncbi:hypothetical protein PoB_005696900 [Plakobranchus ocellatus]|uniref:Uncharacterized protein n=1 Tax=Plakobranchus ocellatus TaxID=259542 RepID=A0AAV4CI29_9GAST|nr:hypothetical protein PoB_005696900 [Plakobranchus ocellatus]